MNDKDEMAPDSTVDTMSSTSSNSSAVPVAALAVGMRIGKYFLTSEISSGGFGTVYRAMQVDRRTNVAIKVLHAELITNASNVRRFEREVEVIRRLRHPNVVQVLDYGQLEDGRPYFAMELLSGENLEQYLGRRGRMAIQEVLTILEPLASALDMAHAQSIIHRDIKASNVFLADDNGQRRVVLLDFGIAKLLDSQDPALTASRQIVGTLHCMSPEQLLGQPVDVRTDIYALGVLAYTMLTGKLPFDTEISGGVNPLGFLYARPVAPSQRARIDSALDEPILSALAREPSNRPSSAGEFLNKLRLAREKSNGAEAPTEGATQRQGIAVHVDVRVSPAILEEPDELLLLDLEGVLPAVSSALWEAGLLPVMETGNNLLMVTECPDEPSLSLSLRRRVFEMVLQVSDKLSRRPDRDPRITVTFVVHTGALVVNDAGALLGGGLLDPASWVPAFAASGVLLSNVFAEGLEVAGNHATDAPDFLLVTGA